MAITSFSQKALLSSLYQNYLNPPKCKLQIVQHPAESLFDSLQNTQQNLGFDPFTSTLRADPLHKTIGPPVRALARMVYMLGVATLIAPVGTLWHGVNAALNIANKQKAREHAYCAYTDLWVIGQTAFTCFISVVGIWMTFAAYMGQVPRSYNTISDRVIYCFGGLFMAITFPIVFLGGIEQDSLISRTVGHRGNHVAMYIALKLHNELGLSGPHGEPLPFAPKDNFYLSPNGEWKDNDGKPSRLFGQLCHWTGEAENELAILAGRANQHLDEDSQCEYKDLFESNKFDGTQVIGTFERKLGSSHDLVAELRRAHRRLSFFKNLVKDAANLACENASSDQKKWTYLIPAMYSDSELNADLFNQPPLSQSSRSLSAILSKPQIIASGQDPRGQEFPNYSFVRFKAYIQYAKWCTINGIAPPAVHMLLGLENNYTQRDLDRAFRRYAQNIHSDHNQISGEWFICLQEIQQLLKPIEVPASNPQGNSGDVD